MRKSIRSPRVASGLLVVGEEGGGREEEGFLSNKFSAARVTTVSSVLAGVCSYKIAASLLL